MNDMWTPSGRGTRALPNMGQIQQVVFPHWEIPRYFGFTEEERQVYYKLCGEAFIPLRSIGHLLNMKTPSMGLKWAMSRRIPVYKIDKVLYVFSGDVVRGVQACKVDYDDPVVSGVLTRNVAARWDRRSSARQQRRDALRKKSIATGTVIPPKSKSPID